VFVAVPLAEPVRTVITELVERVRARAPGSRPGSPPDVRPVRWVRTDGLHLTIRFLGPTPSERFPALQTAIRRVAAQTPPLSVGLAGAGSFPRPDRPRTLWLGVSAGLPELAELAHRLDAELAAAGWASDPRPFRAHLTLARSDGMRAGPETLRLLVAEAAALDERWTADRLMLYESVTGGGAARYEPLFEVPLLATPALRLPGSAD